MQKSIYFKNANIFFSDVGKGSAIVLIHGFLENATMWKNIVPELCKKNRVITIDLLGHGKSDCVGYVHSMNLFAETLTAVLKHLKIRKCFLIGHSLGGYVALAFAKQHPQKIKGLCLINSTSNEDDNERKQIRTRAIKLAKHNFKNIVQLSFNNLFDLKSKTTFKNKIAEGLKEALRISKQGYIAAQEGMKIRPNTNDVLVKNTFKKLFIIGKKDPVLNFESSVLEAKKTNSNYIVFSNGHMSHIENEKDLILALKEFVA